MKSIEEQIEALTQELRPYPNRAFWKIDAEDMSEPIFVPAGQMKSGSEWEWNNALFASTNKAEVEEYADCYRRLKLYQLIGKQKEKEFPIDIKIGFFITDFAESMEAAGGIYLRNNGLALGSAKFAREEDRLEALKICSITKEFQEKCAKYGLGGA